MKNLLINFVTCIAFSISSTAAINRNSANNESEILLSKTLRGIRSALNYLNQQHKYVNLDTIIGTRILEGQFKILLEHIKRKEDSWYVNESILLEIRSLKYFAGQISKKSIPYIAKLTPNYYKKIGILLNKRLWELDYESRDFPNSVKVWPFQSGEALHEEDSDNCIAEFFGTGKNTKEKCAITSSCWKMMTSTGYNGYSLSHEIFYLQIGKQYGCGVQMEIQRVLHGQKSIDAMEADFCVNMLNEAFVIDNSELPEDRQDLFMEQAALCGMLGYRQFFSSEWLNNILSWQDNDLGCFKGNPVHEYEIDYRPQPTEIRQKREERPLAHGCLCHRTTVGLAALGQYVRYILEFEDSTVKNL